jgi:2,3-bisphosphoglycerate-independent phosphoglycerate mutase
MRILFLFFDGVGLGEDDPANNPFAAADLPTLSSLTAGQRWLNGLPRIESERATFIPTDACLGVSGRPQSATGQAAIMTGSNVPGQLGYHYGPKPNPEIITIIKESGLVRRLTESGLRSGLLNAYPSTFIENIERGKRLPSSNQMALREGGVRLLDGGDLLEKRAMSADFTGEMWWRHAAHHDAATKIWRTEFGNDSQPVMAPEEAGAHLAALAGDYDFSFFDCWLTDYIGHRGGLDDAIDALRVIDGVMKGLLAAWDDDQGLIIVTSDHGNIEDLSERSHTRNPVPSLVIGSARHRITSGLEDLTGFAEGIVDVLTA